jgi:hypothetical protein
VQSTQWNSEFRQCNEFLTSKHAQSHRTVSVGTAGAYMHINQENEDVAIGTQNKSR